MKMHMWIKYWWTDSQMANYSTASGRFILKEAILFLVLLSMQQPWGLLSIIASLMTPKFIFSLREMLVSTLYWPYEMFQRHLKWSMSKPANSNPTLSPPPKNTLHSVLLPSLHHLPSCPHQKPENLLNFGLLLFTSSNQALSPREFSFLIFPNISLVLPSAVLNQVLIIYYVS